MPESPSNRYRHPKANRLGGRGTFKAVLEHENRSWRGPIGMAIAPCDAKKSRMGVSIGRHVGNAARRNRIKRLLREAFRLMQYDWPRPFDVVILTKPHVPMTLAEYQRTLSGLMVKLVARSRPTASGSLPTKENSGPAPASKA